MEKRIKAICKRDGYTYYGEKVPDTVALIKNTNLDQGRRQKVSYGIGRIYEGVEMITFLWQYTTGYGKSSTTYQYRIAQIRIPFRENGRISIRKEVFFDKIRNVFGHNDLDFENKEFSDRFYVRARPERFGYDFFHPRMIDIFISSGFNNMIIKDGRILLYEMGGLGEKITSKLKRGINPFLPWMDRSAGMLVKIKILIPSFLLRREGEEERVSFEVLNDNMILCPACSREVEAAAGVKSAPCPYCGEHVYF